MNKRMLFSLQSIYMAGPVSATINNTTYPMYTEEEETPSNKNDKITSNPAPSTLTETKAYISIVNNRIDIRKYDMKIYSR